MTKNSALKNLARRRSETTGELYTDSLEIVKLLINPKVNIPFDSETGLAYDAGMTESLLTYSEIINGLSDGWILQSTPIMNKFGQSEWYKYSFTLGDDEDRVTCIFTEGNPYTSEFLTRFDVDRYLAVFRSWDLVPIQVAMYAAFTTKHDLPFDDLLGTLVSAERMTPIDGDGFTIGGFNYIGAYGIDYSTTPDEWKSRFCKEVLLAMKALSELRR